MKQVSVQQLKALVTSKIAKELILSPHLASGIPKGAITSISGAGKTEFVTTVLAANPKLNVAWIEKEFTANPFALLQRKIELKRVLFIEAKNEMDWVILQVLRAQAFSFVIFYLEVMELTTLRRIQLASEKSEVATLWLAPAPRGMWPLCLELEVTKKKSEIQVKVIKERAMCV